MIATLIWAAGVVMMCAGLAGYEQLGCIGVLCMPACLVAAVVLP